MTDSADETDPEYTPWSCEDCGRRPLFESNGELGSARLACDCDELSITTDGFSLGDVPWTWRRETDPDRDPEPEPERDT